MAGVSSGKYSLESIMDKLKNIKKTQERNSQQYLQFQTASAPPELSFIAGDVLVSHRFAVSKICFELRNVFCNKSRDRQRFIFLQLRACREQHRFLIVWATDF